MRTSDTTALAADIVSMLRKIIYVPGNTITADTRLEDLGLDSLDLVEAGLELEAVVGEDLPDGILTGGANTIGELAASFTGRPLPRQASVAA
jgi:acyl carrier protein